MHYSQHGQAAKLLATDSHELNTDAKQKFEQNIEQCNASVTVEQIERLHGIRQFYLLPPAVLLIDADVPVPFIAFLLF